MAKFRYPAKFPVMVQQFHDNMNARVQDDSKYSQMCSITNRVKQGGMLATTLFSMVFSAMLTNTFRDVDIDIGLHYHTDSKLFNP